MRYKFEDVYNFVKENSKCELLEKEYKNYNTYMNFKCECGNFFKTTFKQFKDMNKRQCNVCGRKNANKNRTYNINYVKQYCNDVGLKLLSDAYTNCKEKLLVECECGEIFESSFDSIKNSNKIKCDKCTGRGYFEKDKPANNLKTTNDFINQLNKVTDEFILLDEYIDAKTPLRFKHIKCGRICYKTPDNILNKFRGCPYCIESKGERKIRNFLEENNIHFEPQKKFKDCKDKRELPFDFYIPSFNLCIEYDGEQHFKEILVFKNNLENIKLHDNIKTKFCLKHKINLLRISYKQFNNIEHILSDMLIPSEAVKETYGTCRD